MEKADFIEFQEYIEYTYYRIRKVYDRNIALDRRDFIWNWCYDQQSTVPITIENLENMANNKLVFGFFGFSDNRSNDPKIISETLFKLAVALGKRGLQNPEGGCNGEPIINRNIVSDSDLLDEIELHIGFKITLPTFTGNKQIVRTNRGIITDRICHYLWVMKRIMELCPDRDSAILEIGAGMGILGYFLDQAGYRDYTTIDLANANACQTYFLAKNLPERDIKVSGDVKYPFSGKYKHSLKLLHCSDFDMDLKNRFSIIINMDGLTEMPLLDAEMYLGSQSAPLFLSINHEMNAFRVCEIYHPYRKMLYRYPFWLRDGYVEELYTEKT